MSFRINQGEFVGIMGASGRRYNLILGLYIVKIYFASIGGICIIIELVMSVFFKSKI